MTKKKKVNKENTMAFKKGEQLSPEELAKLNGEECDNNSYNCGDNCNCGENCDCGENCTCGEDCNCTEQDTCCEECNCSQENETACGCDNSKDSEKEQVYLEMAQRIQAEFDNYRKRTQSSEKDARKNGICFAVEKFLPVIDSLDNAKRQVADESFTKALDLVANQIMQSLSSLGVQKIEAVNQVFDPNKHNAIMTGNEQDKPDDIILEEFQAGFILDGKVIRHSVVKVNKL